MRLDLVADLETIRVDALKSLHRGANAAREAIAPAAHKHALLAGQREAVEVMKGAAPWHMTTAEIEAHAEAGITITVLEAAGKLLDAYEVWVSAEAAIHQTLRSAELRIKDSTVVRDIQQIEAGIVWPHEAGAAR